MLHLGHDVLQHCIRDIADEQIPLAMPERQKMLFGIRGFSYHRMHIRGFSYRVKRIRGFSYQDSGFRVPGFGVLVTRLRGFSYRGAEISLRNQKLVGVFRSRNTLNTSITPINTGVDVENTNSVESTLVP